MPIKDPFSYYGRFDSIDLDCSQCKHFEGPEKWPDVNKVSKCNFYRVSLDFELAENFYKIQERFCKHYNCDVDNSKHRAFLELKTIIHQMEERVIYAGYNGEFLFEKKV